MNVSIEELKESKEPRTQVPELNELIVEMNDSSKQKPKESDKRTLDKSFLKTPFIINNDIFSLSKDKG
jgi:hypothetical protein